MTSERNGGPRVADGNRPGGQTGAVVTGRWRSGAVTRTLVCFHAHPDDEAMLTAGTMAKASADGHRVVLVVATTGRARGRRSGAGRGWRRPRRARGPRSSTARRPRSAWHASRSSATATRGSDGVIGGRRARSSTRPSRRRRRAWRRSCAEEQADVADDVRPARRVRPPRPRPGARGRAGRAPSWPGRRSCWRRRSTGRCWSWRRRSCRRSGWSCPPTSLRPTCRRCTAASDEITHAVDVRQHLEAKRASMQAHVSQTTSAGDHGSVSWPCSSACPTSCSPWPSAPSGTCSARRRPGPR